MIKDTSSLVILFRFAASEPGLLSFPWRTLSIRGYVPSQYLNHPRTTS